MIIYFLLFCGIGFVINKFIESLPTGIISCIVIAILWGLGHGKFWAMVTLGELLLGFVISLATKK